MNSTPCTFGEVVIKTVVAHTVTYFLVGLLAFASLDYAQKFSETDLNLLMRPTSDRMVMAGPLFQPIRGLLFGVLLFWLREPLFGGKHGWLVLWALLVGVGVLGTFGPAPASLEGLIYTKLSLRSHLLALPEIILQPLLLAVVLEYWRHPQRKWLSWSLGIAFLFAMLLPILGLLTNREASSAQKRPDLPKEWIGRWQANPFADTEWIEVQHQARSGGANTIYRVDDAKAVASLLQEMKITSIQNDAARGSKPPSFLTFHKKSGPDLSCGVEKGGCLGTREGLVVLRNGFFDALNRQLSKQENHAVNVLEPLASPQPGRPSAPPPSQNVPEPEPETKEQRALETSKLVARDFPAFLQQVLNVVAHYRQGNHQLIACLSAEESQPIIDALAKGKLEPLDWDERCKKELDALFKRDAASLDLTPGLGFYLMIVISGDKEILVPPYGKLTFANSPIAVLQKAIAGREYLPETIELLPR
jgi:hypothetical protein